MRLTTLADHPCPYLPGRVARTRGFVASEMPADVYRAFMDAGFRRSGDFFYQQVCRSCRQCLQLRVLALQFEPSKRHRRCRRLNADVAVTERRTPEPTAEKYDLFRRYVAEWHGRRPAPSGRPMESDAAGFESFLYDSPTATREYEYRDAAGKLLAVGLADVSPRSFSSVYVYFDPAESRRGLGTFAVLWELAHCRSLGVPHYYFGYWVRDCPAMSYKATYRPCEVLGTDGVWRDYEETTGAGRVSAAEGGD